MIRKGVISGYLEATQCTSFNAGMHTSEQFHSGMVMISDITAS